jgi:hypothetical protein
VNPAVLAIALLGVGIAVASAGSGAGDGPDRPDPPDYPPDATAGETQELIRSMAEALGLDYGWIAFLEAAALGESGFNTQAGEGIKEGAPAWAQMRIVPASADSACRAYTKNIERYFEDCAWPTERYCFGSGGLWQLLPGNGIAAFDGTELVCIDPWSVFDPAPAMVMILEYCRRVMRRSAFKANPTFANLRVGMRSPSKLNQAAELERQRTGHNKLGDRLEYLGYDRSMVDAAVTPLPAADPVGWLGIFEAV